MDYVTGEETESFIMNIIIIFYNEPCPRERISLLYVTENKPALFLGGRYYLYFSKVVCNANILEKIVIKGGWCLYCTRASWTIIFQQLMGTLKTFHGGTNEAKIFKIILRHYLPVTLLFFHECTVEISRGCMR